MITVTKVSVTNTAKKEIRRILSPDFKVEDQYEQQATLYKMMLVVYLILAFILIMATFNITGSLSILIIEKKKDTTTLRAMGADNTLIHNIFLNESIAAFTTVKVAMKNLQNSS